MLKHCLNGAIRCELIQSNPDLKVCLPNPNNERDRVLTDEEWGTLYTAAKAHLRPVLLTAYQLAQRLREIVELSWDRADLKRESITLRSLDTKDEGRASGSPDVKVTLQ